MARSKLPAKSTWHEGGFRFRRRGKGSKVQFSIAVRMPADGDHKSWWFSPQKRVELHNPDDKSELMALAEQYRRELMHPDEVAAQKAAEEAGRLTLREYVGRWRSRRRDAVVAGTIGDETVDREEVELRRIEDYLGDMAIAGITAEDVGDAYVRMARDGVSEYTRARTHAKLKRLLKQARLDGLLAVNVAEDVDPNLKPKQPKPSKKTKDERRVTSREADELAEKILSEEPDGLRVAVWLARTTGMRRGEILGLTWADVDFEGETIYVRRALGRKGIKGTKTYDSMRDIPVAKPVWQYLLKWRDRQQELFKAGFRERDEHGRLVRDAKGEFVMKPKRWSESTPVSTNMDGGIWDVNNFNRSLRIYFADNGLGAFTERVEFKSARKNKDGSPMVQTRKTGYVGASLHSLRHTFATELVAKHVDPKTVQALLGHSNIETTLQLYAEAVEENMREAMTDHAMHVATEQDVGVYREEDFHAYEQFAEEDQSGNAK